MIAKAGKPEGKFVKRKTIYLLQAANIDRPENKEQSAKTVAQHTSDII